MVIEELEDREFYLYAPTALRNEPLLEYVWEVSLEFAKIEYPLEHETFETSAPTIFANRYVESKLTDKERYLRFIKNYKCDNITFEEYSKWRYRKLDTRFKEKFLTNEALQNTIESFGLDVSKLWYLLLFVYDYIEDFAVNAPTFKKSTLEEFNYLYKMLDEATSITLRKGKNKCYETDREDIIKLMRTVFDYYANNYNSILDYAPEDAIEPLNKLGLDEFIEQRPAIDVKNRNLLPVSYKIWYFKKMFYFFLKDREATILPHLKDTVSTDKMMFISRLIYTVGYHGEEYNLERDPITNKKNRMLSDLLRKYAHEEFPPIVQQDYWTKHIYLK